MNDLYIEDSGDKTLGELRAISAYAGPRLLIDVLFWISLVGGLIGFGFYVHLLGPVIQMSPLLLIGWLAIFVIQILSLCVFRVLAYALFDIADAQLQQVEPSRRRSPQRADALP